MKLAIIAVRWLVTLLLVMSATTWTSPSRADEKALAEALFLEGKALMEAGKTEEACKRFRASHQADASVGALLNLARCHQKLGRLASAWSEFREAASLAETLRQPERKQGALEFARGLEPRLSRLTVVVSAPVDGLSVTMGDVDLPSGSFGVATPVDPGTYEIVAQAPDRAPWRTSVTIHGENEDRRVEIPELEPRSAEDAGLHPQAIAGIVLAGVGAASVAVGVVLGIIAIGDEAALDGACPTKRCTPEQLSTRDDIAVKADASTATLIVGAALVVGGGVLFFTAPSDDAGDVAVGWMPVLTPSYQGVGVFGRW